MSQTPKFHRNEISGTVHTDTCPMIGHSLFLLPYNPDAKYPNDKACLFCLPDGLPSMIEADDMLRTAHFAGPNDEYRLALTRVWSAPPLLTWIMLNPSTADATVDDPTIRRCIGFARDLGYGGIRVLNLYAYRATKPADLWLADEPTGGRANDKMLREALSEAHRRGGIVMAGWGANAKPDRVAWLLSQPWAHGLRCLGVTKDGAPRHPLYMPKTATPVRFA